MSGQKGNILKYATLPQILPRCRDLMHEGFGAVAFWIACVFANAGLLTAQHPYLNPDNIGRYSIRDVLAQSAGNLKLSFRHIDQLLIFGLVLLGCVFILLQLAFMAFSLTIHFGHAATAQPTSFADYFLSPLPQTDISFMIMDRIFGIPGIFDSCVALNSPCITGSSTAASFPFPYQQAFQQLLAFYSQGLLVIAGIIFCYHATTLVAEMSQTGSFLNVQSFNRVWAPIRIIAAIGMLIPMSYGYNAGQYIAIYTAKYGSGFATNAWNYYVSSLTSPTVLGDPTVLLSKPNYPITNDFIQFMSMAQTCWYAYDDFYHFKRGNNPSAYGTFGKDLEIEAYVVRPAGVGVGGNAVALEDFMASHANLYEIQKWTGGDIVIAFGDYDPERWKTEKGNVRPFCGEITIPASHINVTGNDGIDIMAYRYLNELVNAAWYDVDDSSGLSTYPIADKVVSTTIYQSTDPADTLPTRDDISKLVTRYDARLKIIVDQAYDAMTTGNASAVWIDEARNYGWAGAGIWYNKIAQLNGAFSEAVLATPMVTKYPEISEQIQNERQRASVQISGEDRFDPNIPQGPNGQKTNINFNSYGANDQKIAVAMNQTYIMFNTLQDDVVQTQTGNAFYDAINALFKKTGLWELRENRDVHPLAQMAGLGKTLLTNTIIVFGSGTAVGMLGILGKKTAIAAALQTLSGFLMGIAMIGLTSGILLYYVVPLLPFIYFFFAVVAWGKTIFEAMIGIPLWALAHLSYQGPGFPTRKSMYGYFLLLDIFIRPVLVIFGLVASTTIFYALVRTLNDTFNVLTSNLAGFHSETANTIPSFGLGGDAFQRGPIDELCYTVMYAVVVYMIGISCFKMIDLLPQKILRWMDRNTVGFGSMVDEGATDRLKGMITNKSSELGGMAGGGVGKAVGAKGLNISAI